MEHVGVVSTDTYRGGAMAENFADKHTQTDWIWCPEGDQGQYKRIEDLDDTDTSRSTPIDDKPSPLSSASSKQKENDGTENTSDAETISIIKQRSLSDLINELHLDLNDDSDKESSTSSNDSDRDYEDEEQGRSGGINPPHYQLPADNLPWPKLLQYLRESESASSEYFSLPFHREQLRKQREAVSNGKADSVSVAEAQEELCQFCDKTLKKVSFENEEPEFCCSNQKEFWVLTAIFTKKMMEDKVKKMPGKIPIEKNKVTFMKTPAERALERIRRKMKWEENERNKLRMLERSNFHSLHRQTRLIQFSLSSPACIAKEWIKQESPTKGKKLPAMHSSAHMQLPPLPSDVQDACMKTKEPEVQKYNTSRQSSAVCLPDGTGQWYYPSGNIAVVKMVLEQPSVVSYMLFEDGVKGNMIGYVDELGRSWLNKDETTIRSLSSLGEIVIFDNHGRMKKLSQANSSSLKNFFPLIFKINRYLCVRYNSQDNIVISLASEQQQYRFKVLKKATEHNKILQLPSMNKREMQYNIQLENMKLRFKSHLDCFEKATKSVKTVGLLPSIGRERMRVRHHEGKPQNLKFSTV